MTRDAQHECEHETEAEILMTRLVDREASPSELARFEHLAGGEGSLWRDLALRQLEMGMLAGVVAQQTVEADRVELPQPRRSWVNLSVTFSGWAALVIVGLAWAVAGGGDRLGPESGGAQTLPAVGTPAGPEHPDLTPEEHLARYIESAWVLGELDPILLEPEPLDDGRIRLRFVRRIEEYVDVDASVIDEGVTDERGHFVADPAELREPR